MKTFFTLATLLLAGSASAASAIHEFRCVTDKAIETRGHRGPTKFAFAVQGLERGKVRYVETDDGEPVRMAPRNSTLALNDNYGIRRTRDGILLESDAAGCQLNTVVLYERAGYRRGYARTKDIGCGKDDYSTVTCEVEQK